MKDGIIHTPVLLDKSIEFLNVRPDGIYVDATLGDAGHSTEILKKLGSGKLISIDWDIESVNFVKENNPLARVDNWIIEHDSFTEIPNILKKHNINNVDGIIFDLGLSSRQLENKKRGFSYYGTGNLDMRMDNRLSVSAKDLIYALSQKELEILFKKYGEEKLSSQIAKAIVTFRKNGKLNSTRDLVAAIYSSIKGNYDRGRKHPARRVFQALRIAVNDEIFNLRKTLPSCLSVIKPGGRIVVICYQSLEYKEVENFINQNFENLNILTPLPISPDNGEIEQNQRARSAKLYALEKVNTI